MGTARRWALFPAREGMQPSESLGRCLLTLGMGQGSQAVGAYRRTFQMGPDYIHVYLYTLKKMQ